MSALSEVVIDSEGDEELTDEQLKELDE